MESKEYVTPGRFKTGSIYTILNRMEHQGLLTSNKEKSEIGRTRRVYSITPQGTRLLKKGLNSVIKRKKIMEDLTVFFYEHFEKTPNNKKRGEI
jgi:DNA-binding PadR family transcriptional regulator